MELRRRSIVGIFIFIAYMSLPVARASATWVEGPAHPSLAPMLKQVLPAVVNVSTKSLIRVEQSPLFADPFFRRFFNVPHRPQQEERQSLGSGVIVDANKGYVLTNYHVIKHAQEISVTLHDGRHFPATVVGKDPEVDLAVLHIKADNLKALPFGDSSALQVGDFVAAIGNPFGLGQTVTSGIVSALGRNGLGIEGYEDFIQTDAAINPGNSGGALVNLAGQLVGINTAIMGAEGGNVGIGFAIPSNMAKDDMEQLIRYGNVRRGQLGVYIQDVTPDLAKALDLQRSSGAVISKVMKGSPAQRVGLEAGDVVIAVNGEEIKTADQLRNTIGLLRVGSEVTLTVLHNGEQRELRVVISQPRQAKVDAGRLDKRLSGAKLGDIEPSHPVAGQVNGVEVLGVEEGSPAWAAGLRKGDVIVSVNRQPVANTEEFESAVKKSSHRILLNIRRGEGALFILIQ
ncbi:MAG: DegQ family serine endoprotease [Gammaproteobacteria bacterium]|jgi:Do/DeqQ family serine protease